MMTRSTSPTPTIVPDEIRAAMRTGRPDLLEDWTTQGITPAELARVAANAQWLWERHQAASSDWTSTLRKTGELRDYSIGQAIWLATRQDLDNENTFDRDPDTAALNETSLRSGWFST